MKIRIALALAVMAQVLALVGMQIHAAMPLYFGQEIRVATVPVDPRSLLRGNYVVLNYPFSRIPDHRFTDAASLRNGEVVYVRLAPDTEGCYMFTGVTLEPPTSGTFLRGRIQWRRGSVVQIRYGIEAFFLPESEAKAAEKAMASGGIAVLMVDGGGRAAVKSVETKR